MPSSISTIRDPRSPRHTPAADARRPRREMRFVAKNAPCMIRMIIKGAYCVGIRPKPRIPTWEERERCLVIDRWDEGDLPDPRNRLQAFRDRLWRHWITETSKEHAWANPHMTPKILLEKGF